MRDFIGKGCRGGGQEGEIFFKITWEGFCLLISRMYKPTLAISFNWSVNWTVRLHESTF